MVCPYVNNIKSQITRIFRRICEVEHRIEVLEAVFIPRGTWETVGRYVVERRDLQATLDSLYLQWSQLESQLALLSSC